MEVKPGYKQTEVGVIPEDWRVEPVEQISTVGRGRVISHRAIARSLNHRYPVYSSQTSNNGVMGYLDTPNCFASRAASSAVFADVVCGMRMP